MTSAASGSRSHALTLGMLAFLAVAGWLLLSRNLGLNPAIFADEWFYSKMARLMELKDAIVPSYLYLWLFGASAVCGAGFLDCVRGANVVLFLAAAPFVYMVARQYAGRPLATLLAMLSVIAPVNIFTAYFMPEATYYFGFWLLTWIALTRARWGWQWQAVACGLVLGAMSLVKVHALFLLPALCLFVLYARWHQGGKWLGEGVAAMLLAAAAMLAVKFGLGYLLAGDAGLSLFGPFYQGAANVASTRSPLAFLAPAFINFRGHLMALAILAGLPLALLAHRLLLRAFRARGEPLNLLHLYTLLMLGAAAGLTVLFTASIAHQGKDEVVRLHLRYYSFVFPLLWMIAAAATREQDARGRQPLRWAIAAALLAVLAAALFKLPTYALNPVDGIEIFAVRLRHYSGLALLALGAAAIALWTLRQRDAAWLFTCVALPALLATGLEQANIFLDKHRADQAADLAGKFAARTVPAGERDQITVAGTDLSQLMRAQFHIDHKDSAVLELAPMQPLAPYQIPLRKKWLLVVGPHALPDGVKPVAATPHYALVKIDTATRVLGRAALSEPFGKGLIAAAEGLSYAESWGRWSDAKRVVLHFNQPLPRHANIVLTAQAYERNAEQPFTLRVGENAVPFRLYYSRQEVAVRIETDGNQKSLVIEVPHPVSPSELGRPGDDRKLGIGIAEIEISTPAGASVASG